MRPVDTVDCKKCGCCCVAMEDNTVWADVEEEDAKRLGSRLVREHVVEKGIKTRWKVQKTGPFREYELCACTFLRGSVLHRVSCSVYDKRPQVCRVAFQPGDRECLKVRKWFLRKEIEMKK